MWQQGKMPTYIESWARMASAQCCEPYAAASSRGQRLEQIWAAINDYQRNRGLHGQDPGANLLLPPKFTT